MATLAEHWVEQGRQEGLRLGWQQAKMALAAQTIRILQRLLGEFDTGLLVRICALTWDELVNLGEAAFDFQSAAELAVWLDRNAGGDVLN